MDIIQNKKTNPYQYICVEAITEICNKYIANKFVNGKIDMSDVDYVIRGAMFDHYCSLILFHKRETQDYEIRNAYHNNEN